MKNNKGITITSLIITIIVMVILAGIALMFSMGESGVITKAENTRFLEDIKLYKEELELYKGQKQIENQKRITNGENIDLHDGIYMSTWTISEMKLYIPSIEDEYEGKLGIEDGELTYKDSGNEDELSMARAAGLKIKSERATLEVEILGEGSVTGVPENGETKIGAKIKLKAVEGTLKTEESTIKYEFAGWYEDGELVEEKLEYNFEITKENTKITAKFKTNVTVVHYEDDKVGVSTGVPTEKNNATITKIEIPDGLIIPEASFVGWTSLKIYSSI